jgi:hypothetical protein
VIPSGNDYIPRPFKLGFLDVGAICLEGFFFCRKLKYFMLNLEKLFKKYFSIFHSYEKLSNIS